ncbi:nuclear transport factor 2 family protein [Agrobacterium vitis]|uniref:Nuclear transport factor 2 family protein n=1 Tax=Agrobacterium vitis TaxID=373 RepID=A0A6L6VLV1_AGRVI|nr:nuclear transport factor 2 family protein [Agrobacterium vitis]MUZ76011.1 nuclear transport factor 2 family protein [Agrobacterium vitis]
MTQDSDTLAGRLEATEAQLRALTKRLQVLEARSSISDTILRFARGLDRLDRVVMISAFHPDATVDFGTMFNGSVDDFIDFTMKFQRPDIPVQHLIGNISIKLLDDKTAVAESYELARHPAPPDVEGDMILATRLLDRFECRDGQWRIASRTKVGDWARIHHGANPMFEKLPLQKAKRNQNDPSYALFEE